MITLNNLKPFRSKRKGKRVGRGNSSGHGTYSGRGQKGQKSRSGGRKGLKLKGLRKIIKRVPKMGGFKSIHKRYIPVNLRTIARLASQNITKIGPAVLAEKRIIKDAKAKIKILGKGKLSQGVEVMAHAFSKSAEEAIKRVGGVIKLIK